MPSDNTEADGDPQVSPPSPPPHLLADRTTIGNGIPATSPTTLFVRPTTRTRTRTKTKTQTMNARMNARPRARTNQDGDEDECKHKGIGR